ncbi:hypothetical protein SAMN04487779_1005197 [Belnapia rosea]|uniref:Uncharacterized protein n=1 Tax=Belnapia rosea TaxID=938405 RepID=A0A1G6SX82_9PROT|nr:hypothetical protein SAMN04487779_1005197 [Belnapia rosea]
MIKNGLPGMAQAGKSKTGKASNRFYRSAKVSEYQFKRVLWSFAQDQAAGEAAKQIALSANSIDALYSKLRVFFTEIGLFTDIYKGGDPNDGTDMGEDGEGYELRLIAFHLERVKRKRRMKETELEEVDYNWCESRWRFEYSILTEGRPSDTINRMMYSHLLAHIRLSGPVGSKPQVTSEIGKLTRQQVSQRLLWLERNAPAFKDEATRTALREIRQRRFEDQGSD